MNLTDVQLALRAQALTLSVATTGSATLAAAATGYTRAAGSFVTDGFVTGMEILPAGFTTNTPRVIQSVTATAIVVRTAAPSAPLTVEAAAAGRSLVCGLPSLRGWDNQRVNLLGDRWAVEEEFKPQPGRVLTTGPNAVVRRQGLYILRLYAVEGPGMAAPSRWMDDLLALFLPNSTLVVTGGGQLYISGDLTPWYDGPFRTLAGWSQYVVTIPWWMLASNS